jgi:short-subunit dehydrogenase
MAVAVVSGATKGIGRAIVEKLASESFDLALCARSNSDLSSLRNELATAYPHLEILIEAVDVGDEGLVKGFARKIIEQFGRVDILVNNAGVYYPGNLHDEPEGQLEHMLRVNLLSAYHLTRALLPIMIDQQKGHIFNMSSIAGLQAYPGGGAYSISKYALQGFSTNLRLELRDKGIKVTSLCPGATWTNSWSGSGVSRERIMEATDVANILWTAYNLSPKACPEQIVLRPQLGDL